MLKVKKEKGLNYYKNLSRINLKEADLVLKTLAQLDSFLDLIEQVENSNIYRHDLKKYGSMFKKELVRSIGIIFNTSDKTQSEAFWVMDQVDQLDELIKNTHISKYPDLIRLLERFHELEGADTDTFIKSVVTRQYATLSEFVLPGGLVAKVKEIVPLVDKMPLIQLAKQMPKQRLQNTKGFGEQSIKVLEEVFSTSGIVW